MKLILDLFRRIFEALQGVYTKAETDSALALKADATALTEEATARQEAISAEASRVDTRLAEHDAEIDTLQKVTAGLGEGAQAAANVAKWQTYATAMQKELDAETAMQLAQEFSRATDEYLADPTATDNWNTTSATESTNPHFGKAPTKPIVDFRVVSAVGFSNTAPSFNKETNVMIFLPSLLDATRMLANTKLSVIPLLPNAKKANALFFDCLYLTSAERDFACVEVCNSMFQGCLNLTSFAGGLPKASSATYMFYNCRKLNSARIRSFNATHCHGMFNNCSLLTSVDFNTRSVKNGNMMFAGASLIDEELLFPSLHTGDDMFLNAGMNAANISAVLDSLPSDPVGAGGTGVITFTGCPGAAELTQESASVAAATARGWTVEL